MGRARLRDLGIVTGRLAPGRWNAITDVPGVRVGTTTLIRDEPCVVRTGVTAIWPRGLELWSDAVFAGIHFAQRKWRAVLSALKLRDL
jgi:D-aminopeptidase